MNDAGQARNNQATGLASRSALYVLSGGMRRVTNLVLLLILLSRLTPAEFSRYGLLLSALAVLVPLLSLNLHLSPSRLFFDHESHPDRSRFLSTVLTAAAVGAAASLMILLVAMQAASVVEPLTRGAASLQLYMAGIVLCAIATEFGLVLMKIEGRASRFLTTELAGGLTLLGAFMILSYFQPDSVRCLFLAHLLSAAVTATAGLLHARSYLRAGAVDRDMALAALRFAAPTVVHVTAFWMIASSGRWIGSFYMSLDDLATFTLLTFLVMFVGMFARALFEARMPEVGTAFARYRQRDAVRLLEGAMIVAVAIIVVGYLAGILALPVLEKVLPEAYRPTLGLLVLAGLANLFDAAYLRGTQILTGLKKTPVLALSTVVAGAISVLLAVVLTRQLQTTGLMIATSAGYFFQAVSSNLLAARALRRASDRDRSGDSAELDS